METLSEMVNRHNKEIIELRKNCEHEFEYDKFENGNTNLMRWVCSKCGKIQSRPFTIRL